MYTCLVKNIRTFESIDNNNNMILAREEKRHRYYYCMILEFYQSLNIVLYVEFTLYNYSPIIGVSTA